MIFAEHNETENITATMQTMSGKKQFNCSFQACPNPICTCRTLTITFIPLDVIPDNEPHPVEIDLPKKKLVDSFKKSASKENLNFAKTVLSQMNADDFLVLHFQHHRIKNEFTKNVDIDTVEAFFDYDSVEEHSELYAYTDVFPFATALDFETGEGKFFVIDQYCLREDCKCTTVSLGIVQILPDKKSRKSKGKEVCYIDLDYKKRRWEIDKEISPEPSLQEIRTAIKKHEPKLYELLLSRHRKLKRIYSNNKRQHREEAPVKVPVKIGRNDPCPCGSGKKYKTCCM